MEHKRLMKDAQQYVNHWSLMCAVPSPLLSWRRTKHLHLRQEKSKHGKHTNKIIYYAAITCTWSVAARNATHFQTHTHQKLETKIQAQTRRCSISTSSSYRCKSMKEPSWLFCQQSQTKVPAAEVHNANSRLSAMSCHPQLSILLNIFFHFAHGGLVREMTSALIWESNHPHQQMTINQSLSSKTGQSASKIYLHTWPLQCHQEHSNYAHLQMVCTKTGTHRHCRRLSQTNSELHWSCLTRTQSLLVLAAEEWKAPSETSRRKQFLQSEAECTHHSCSYNMGQQTHDREASDGGGLIWPIVPQTTKISIIYAWKRCYIHSGWIAKQQLQQYIPCLRVSSRRPKFQLFAG